ncbi:unnamed protein product, partial [Prorocentrum cordatum]
MATVPSPPSAGLQDVQQTPLDEAGEQEVATRLLAIERALSLQVAGQPVPGAVRLDRNLAAHAEIGKGAGVLGLPVAEKRRRQRGRRRGRKQSELSDTAGPSDEKDEHWSNLVCTDSDQGCDNPHYKYGDGDKEKIEKVVHDTFNLMDQRTSTLLSFEGKQKELETIDNPFPKKALETDQAVQDTDVARESQHKGVLKEDNSSASSAPLECMKNEPSLGKGGKSKPRGSYAMVNIGVGKSGFEPLGRPSFEQPAPRPLVVEDTVEVEALQSHLALPRLAPRLMAIGHGGSAVVLGDVPMVTSNAAEEAGGAEGGDGDCLEDDSWADGAVRPAPLAGAPAAAPGAAAVVLGVAPPTRESPGAPLGGEGGGAVLPAEEAPAAAAAAATAGAVAVEDDDGPEVRAALISAWIRTPGARVADLQPHFAAWPLPRLRAWLAEAVDAPGAGGLRKFLRDLEHSGRQGIFDYLRLVEGSRAVAAATAAAPGRRKKKKKNRDPEKAASRSRDASAGAAGAEANGSGRSQSREVVFAPATAKKASGKEAGSKKAKKGEAAKPRRAKMAAESLDEERPASSADEAPVVVRPPAKVADSRIDQPGALDGEEETPVPLKKKRKRKNLPPKEGCADEEAETPPAAATSRRQAPTAAAEALRAAVAGAAAMTKKRRAQDEDIAETAEHKSASEADSGAKRKRDAGPKKKKKPARARSPSSSPSSAGAPAAARRGRRRPAAAEGSGGSSEDAEAEGAAPRSSKAARRKGRQPSAKRPKREKGKGKRDRRSRSRKRKDRGRRAKVSGSPKRPGKGKSQKDGADAGKQMNWAQAAWEMAKHGGPQAAQAMQWLQAFGGQPPPMAPGAMPGMMGHGMPPGMGAMHGMPPLGPPPMMPGMMRHPMMGMPGMPGFPGMHGGMMPGAMGPGGGMMPGMPHGAAPHMWPGAQGPAAAKGAGGSSSSSSSGSDSSSSSSDSDSSE